MDTIPLLIFQCLDGVVWGLIFAMIVLGLSLTFGLMNLMNVAHGSFYKLGALAACFRPSRCRRRVLMATGLWCVQPTNAC